MRRIAILMGALVLATAGEAGTYRQIHNEDACSARGTAHPELMINGCLQSINTGQLPPDALAGAWSNIGAAYVRLQQDDKAVEAFGYAIKASPDFWAPYVNRGGVYFRQGHYDLAAADYDAALRAKPGRAGTYRDRGEAYLALKKYDAAIADYSEAIRIEPDNAESYGMRAKAYDGKGQADLAAADRVKLKELDPDNTTGLR